MIRVFPNKLKGEPIETHEIKAPTAVRDWLRGAIKSYRDEDSPPISVEVNGVIIAPANWGHSDIYPADDVRIFVEPKGPELIIAAVTLGAALSFVTGLFTPRIPKAGGGGSQEGERLSGSTAKGNQAALNSPIPEIAGRRKRYPDYLIPPHSYYAAEREYVTEMLLCVGWGKYAISDSSVLVGDTPFISLGDDALFDIYEPGASVAGDSRADWWHSAEEVGNTKNGSAGLELSITSDVPTVPTATRYVFSGFTVTVPSGAGSFPAGWAAGMIVTIQVQYPYTVTDGGAGRDVITGDIDQLGFADGEPIQVAGANAGLYYVFDIDTGTDTLTLDLDDLSPATGLQLGAVNMAIGYRGFRYRITAASTTQITVERLDSTGATDGDWTGFSDITSTTAVIRLDQSDAQGGYQGPFCACPEGELTSTIEVDLFYPEGLIWITGTGGEEAARSIVEVDYRDFDTAGAWTTVTYDVTRTQINQIGFTRTISLPYPMRPEVRARKVLFPGYTKELGTRDRVEWQGLRAKLEAPTSYPGATTMTVKIRAGDKLAAQAENRISLIARRILPVRFEGVDIGEFETRNPADWVRYVAKSVGYTDADLDLDELDRLGAIWALRGDWYDDLIGDRTTVKEALNDALGAGYAELTIDGARLRPVRDEPRTAIESMYTPQNMTQTLTRDFQAITPDDFDGVDVEYVDGRTWQWETVQCRLPGDAGTRVEKIRVNGVTDRDRAWRIGMRQRRSQFYRRWSFKFATEMDAFNSRYLSYVALGDDVPGYGQSALLEAYDAGLARITVSEPFEWEPMATHIVALRKPDGRLSGPYVTTQVSEFVLQLSAPLDFVPVLDLSIEPPHVLFGTSTRWAYPALITEIRPNGIAAASVTATNYSDLVYADDNNSAPS